MPQRSATAAQCAVVCSPCLSDDEDWAHCPHPSTRLRARRLLREEKRRPPALCRMLQSERSVRSSATCGAVVWRRAVACQSLHCVSAQVADCFHKVRLSGEIRHFFCWPGVSNKYLKMTEVEGTKVSSNQTLWPMCCSLPMGFLGASSSLSPQTEHH